MTNVVCMCFIMYLRWPWGSKHNISQNIMTFEKTRHSDYGIEQIVTGQNPSKFRVYSIDVLRRVGARLDQPEGRSQLYWNIDYLTAALQWSATGKFLRWLTGQMFRPLALLKKLHLHKSISCSRFFSAVCHSVSLHYFRLELLFNICERTLLRVACNKTRKLHWTVARDLGSVPSQARSVYPTFSII